MLRAEAALPTQPLPVHLLDGPTADLQELGQFPLAHSLRPLHPDVVPLLRGRARPPAGETPLGPRLRLASSARILPMEQPARTSRSTCRSRFLSSGSLIETLAYPYTVILLYPWLEYLKYRILPKVLQLGFPAAPSATGSDGFQPCRPTGAGPGHPYGLRDHAAGPMVLQCQGGEVYPRRVHGGVRPVAEMIGMSRDLLER